MRHCVGGHYNPFGLLHGGPDDPAEGVFPHQPGTGSNSRHVGSLGNIVADRYGVAAGVIVDSPARLFGPSVNHLPVPALARAVVCSCVGIRALVQELRRVCVVACAVILCVAMDISGATSIVGRAMVLHAGEDDLGQGGESDSLTTGHAGARLGCGEIVGQA